MSLPTEHQVHRLVLVTTTITNPRLYPTKDSRWKEAAQPTLDLLPSEDECAKALRFHFPADAVLSLASSLLKHLAIVRATGTPWRDSLITQERHLHNGKPFFGPGGIAFNVSHHGVLAVLAYVGAQHAHSQSRPSGNSSNVESKETGRNDALMSNGSALPAVGVDVVEIRTEKDLTSIRRAGSWGAWVDIFTDAFSPAELDAIRCAGAADSAAATTNVTPQQGAATAPEDLAADPRRLRHALRTFYTYWSLKEAYIKMTSEALMAAWLRQLEFRAVRLPVPSSAAAEKEEHEIQSPLNEREWITGEPVRDIEIWLRGTRVTNVHIELQAVGLDYMIATAINQPPPVNIRPIELIDVATHIKPLVDAE